MRGHSARVWYTKTDITQSTTRSFAADHIIVIRVYDQAGNVIETQMQAGDFKKW
jgi:hypothetical protein